MQRVLGPFALRDVANDPCKGATISQLSLTHSQVHGEDRSILTTPDDLAADADDLLFPGLAVVLQIPVVLPAVGLGHEYPDIPPDHFHRGVTENALGSRVEAVDDAVLVNSDDSIDGRCQDGVGAGLTVAQGFFGGLAIDGAHKQALWFLKVWVFSQLHLILLFRKYW